MNIQQAKILVEKINSLLKSMSVDANHLSAIERDLMLSYIRQLYEAFLEDSDNNSTLASNISNKRTPDPEPVRPARETRIQPEAPKRTYKPPKIIEIPDSIKELEKESPVPTPRRNATPPPPPPPQPSPRPRPQPQANVPSPKRSNPEIQQLFEHKAATELSEKLSLQPIRDLTRAISINDKLLFANELFGKDNRAMTDSLNLLNKYDSIEEAKGLLVNLAEQYEWTDESKISTARNFIKLIRRRYAR